MICILHGYLLEGSGSNLWTRSVIEALCRTGETVHLVCQENHPERYEFIAEAYRYDRDGSVTTMLAREIPYSGKCIMHKPQLGDTLPVYVWDKYEEFARVVPMVDLPDDEIESYVTRNTDVVRRVVRENGITVMQANHMVLMSVVAQRVHADLGTPYVIMPHGSALEYAVRPDARFREYARLALRDAKALLVSSAELAERVLSLFADLPGLRDKVREVRVGVDTTGFMTVEREQRCANIHHLATLLREMPDTSDPNAKLPDRDAADKLQSVNWYSDNVVLYVGRLIAEKGVQCLIAALPEIVITYPNTRLVIAGHGPLRLHLEQFLHALHGSSPQLADEIARTHLDGVPEYFETLRRESRLEQYYDVAHRLLTPDRWLFIGYFTHRELRWLFPCCDAGVFPSMVKESGPMVFLEALSSGCFPVATYFAGARNKIDTVAPYLDPAAAEFMKLRPDPEVLTYDIVRSVCGALSLGGKYQQALRRIAEQEYDWKPIAAKLALTLRNQADGTSFD